MKNTFKPDWSKAPEDAKYLLRLKNGQCIWSKTNVDHIETAGDFPVKFEVTHAYERIDYDTIIQISNIGKWVIENVKIDYEECIQLLMDEGIIGSNRIKHPRPIMVMWKKRQNDGELKDEQNVSKEED